MVILISSLLALLAYQHMRLVSSQALIYVSIM